MRARLLVPLLVAVAITAGVLIGARLPVPSGSAGPVSLPGTSPGTSPTTSPATDPIDGAIPGPTTATGPHPFENYPIERVKPGEKPPQFVVVSFDGACLREYLDKYLALAERTNSRFTFFLSGLCLVPDEQRFAYRPPGKPAGTSAIGFADRTLVNGRIEDWSRAYDEGHEIGTHFLGHFCDQDGVSKWSSADWRSELDQARRFLDNWATINAKNPDADTSLDLSFASSVWRGARTPCLMGRRDQMYPVWKDEGFTYDASNSGLLQWPEKMRNGLWNFPLQTIRVLDWPGDRSNLSMDYNFLATQNAEQTWAPRPKCDRIQRSTYASLMAALEAVENGNRAPFMVGNHFNDWACGAYRKALVQFIDDAHEQYDDVRFVSFEYLVAWLEAQRPSVVRELRARGAQSYR